MTKVLISEGFKQDLKAIETEKLLLKILDTIELLELLPSMGSTDVPVSIKQAYSDGVRKIPVGPFDIITVSPEGSDVVEAAGLMHQKQAW